MIISKLFHKCSNSKIYIFTKLLCNKNIMKYLLGAVIGIFILLTIIFCYRKIFVIDRYNGFYYKSISVLVSPSKTNDKDTLLIDYKIALSNLEERNNSTNKRIDDLYIFGGIIITLLLAINISVYVNAESVVNKFLKENYNEYNEKIKNYTEQAEIEFIKLSTEVKIITEFREKIETKQTQEIINDRDDSIRKP